MKKIKNLNLRLGALALVTSSMFTLCGCIEAEMAPKEDYDIVEQVDSEDGLSTGLKQVIDVPGRDFKLVTEYSCDNAARREWRITSDKFLYFSVNTQGLLDGTEVYIDNIHIDTSIKSKYACMDGITQDTMDDRVHSSQLIGFPISDTVKYYGVNAIEGCNDSFIKGTTYGYNGYYSTTYTERRYTESDYLSMGVYANKIQIVYDLLIKGPNDKDFANVSVSTDFLVPIANAQVEKTSKGEKATQKTK